LRAKFASVWSALNSRLAQAWRSVRAWKLPHWALEAGSELRTVLFLVAVAALIHETHFPRELTTALTAQSMRWVHRVESQRGGEMADPESYFSPAPKIRVLRVTPQAYDAIFCGISPIPRDPLADLIEVIANELPDPKDGPKPVIGIDADITITRSTVANASTCGRAPQLTNPPASPSSVRDDPSHARMKEAVRQLRQRAHVVAIVTARTGSATETEIERRNESMADLCSEGVAFATSNEYLDVDEPDYRFIGETDDASGSVYPSLGNLMAVRACMDPGNSSSCGRPVFGQVAKQARKQPPEEFPLRREKFPTWNLCGRLRAADLSIVDEPISESSPHWLKVGSVGSARYKWLYLDSVRSSALITWTPIGIPEQAKKISQESLRKSVNDALKASVTSASGKWERAINAKQVIGRPMLLLSFDDGFSDRHSSLTDQYGQSNGDTLMAARAFSFIQPLEQGRWLNIVLDAAVGVLYLVLWTQIRSAMAWRLRSGWRFRALAGYFVMPLLLAYLVGSLAVFVSARLLWQGIWLDPILILFFLVLHSYIAVFDWALGSQVHRGAEPQPSAVAPAADSTAARVPVPRADELSSLCFRRLQWIVIVGVPIYLAVSDLIALISRWSHS